MGNEFIPTGSIGANAPELSRYILDNDEIINEAVKSLQGYVKLIDKSGEEYLKYVEGRAYNDQCVAWMRNKLRTVLNKNTFLSQLDVNDMYRVASFMAAGFRKEIFLSAKEFGVDSSKMVELHNMYNDYLDLAIRRALNESDKRFFQNTHSEAVQKVHQTIDEREEKKGWTGKLFG